MCNPKCIYFPRDAFNRNEFETDEFGTKLRKCKYFCLFDDSLIESWDKKCPYKKFLKKLKKKLDK